MDIATMSLPELKSRYEFISTRRDAIIEEVSIEREVNPRDRTRVNELFEEYDALGDGLYELVQTLRTHGAHWY